MFGDVMNQQMTNLTEMIARLTEGKEELKTPVPGLLLFREEAPGEPRGGLYIPSICMIAQGAKQVFLGKESFQYDAQHYLVTSLHLPTIIKVIEASKKKPLLGLRLEIDLHEVAQMMVDSHLPAPRVQHPGRGMAVGKVTPRLAGAFERLLELLDSPEDIPILAPIIRKEILYRLLVGDQGPRLRLIATMGSQSNHIAAVVNWLNENYTEPLLVEDLARRANMSTSTFHQHFRSMTALSPLQYQKQLRLNEARRLMLVKGLDATQTAFEVGYESPSQFSREYRRLFGAPPLRDISTLRENAAARSA
jgi:AraC-like DNA-binding protein